MKGKNASGNLSVLLLLLLLPPPPPLLPRLAAAAVAVGGRMAEIPGAFTNTAVGLKKKLRAHNAARSTRKALANRPIIKAEFSTPASSLAARRAARIPRAPVSGARNLPYRPAPEGDDQRWGG